MPKMTADELRRRVGRFPRVELIHLPTPVRKLENLTAALGGPSIYIKRDDLTGLAFGGNKSRKLEFIVRDMLDKAGRRRHHLGQPPIELVHADGRRRPQIRLEAGPRPLPDH